MGRAYETEAAKLAARNGIKCIVNRLSLIINDRQEADSNDTKKNDEKIRKVG